MDNNLLLGILGIIGTVLAPIVTLFIKQYLDQRPLKNLSSQRRKSIEGNWKGTVTHKNPMQGWPKSVPIELKFSVKRKKVIGAGSYHSFVDSKERKWKLEGGFRTDQYLLLNYQNSDLSVIHFGSIILRLSSNGKIMSGNLIGYGPENEAVISALIDLEK